MSITRVRTNVPFEQAVESLKNNDLENEGLAYQGKFNTNKVDAIVSTYGMDQKYYYLEPIGASGSTYTDWTHFVSKTGYDIWSITPTNYQTDTLNELYMDDRKLDFRGNVTIATDTSFSYVTVYNGSIYSDDTTEASTTAGTAFPLMSGTSSALYVGHSTTFSGINFNFSTLGAGYSLTDCVSYWNGSSWPSGTMQNLTDNTSAFISNGKITFTAPSDWATTSVNGNSAYWIKIITSATPRTVATCNYIMPTDSVANTLALSSTQAQTQQWAWCDCSGTMYVTIRNTGNSSYEGNTHITSTSTSQKLQEFFTVNHQYESNYRDSSFSGGDITITGNVTDGSNTLTVANIDSAYDHVSNNGTDHSYIDQDVSSTASPTFVSGTYTGGVTSANFNTSGFVEVTKSIYAGNVITNKSEYDNGDSGSTATINWANGNNQRLRLTNNCTCTFLAPSGVGNFLLRVVQDGTGSRLITWPATVKWVSGSAPTLTTDADAEDITTFYWNSSNYYGVANLDFSVPA